jgi:hypothetical protein
MSFVRLRKVPPSQKLAKIAVHKARARVKVRFSLTFVFRALQPLHLLPHNGPQVQAFGPSLILMLLFAYAG